MSALTTSRRGLLGAMAALPAVAAVPTFAAVSYASPREWDAALAAVERARKNHQTAYEAFEVAEAGFFRERKEVTSDRIFRAGDTTETFNARQQAQRAAAIDHNDALKHRLRYDELEDACNDALDLVGEAEDVMIRTPAPNMEAAIYKLEQAMKLQVADRDFEYIAADLRRLAGEARS